MLASGLGSRQRGPYIGGVGDRLAADIENDIAGLKTMLGRGTFRIDRRHHDAFLTGASPEEIAQDFPVLRLDDIYAVLTYYLRHRDEVEAYLRERRSRAETLRREIETHASQTGLRDRLLARLGR